MRLGVTIPLAPFQNPYFADLVRHADRLGYTDAWTYETFATDAFAPLAAAAMVTERMRLGTAIVSVFTRSPALIAMSAATVQQISNGRLVLGVGISTPTIAQEWMGAQYRRPVTRLKETVEALRAIFSGQKVVMEGKAVRINGFRLDVTLDKPPPIYVGAQGSLMLRTAGEVGDGLVVNFITPETFPGMFEHVRAGAQAAGKAPADIDVVCRILIVVDEDDNVVRPELRRALTAYLTVPQYNRFFKEIGYENEARTAIEAWSAGDRKKALNSVPDSMVESIFVFGSADSCRRRLEAYRAAGITTTALQFTSFAPTPEERRARIMRAMEAIASG